MKNLKLFDKLVFVLNSLLATALLLSYLLVYIPPKSFPLIAVLSLGVPILIFLNLIFLGYWLLKLKRQFLLSLAILLLGFDYVSGLYQFSAEDPPENPGEALRVMSYNVRLFNAFNWSEDPQIPQKISGFIEEKGPDILAVQEYSSGEANLRRMYPHHFIKLKRTKDEFGTAIFSRYPIINSHSMDFPHHGNNNGIYADVVIGKDTLRIFNVHFQSLNIKPEIEELQKEDSKKLLGRIGAGFAMQQEQMELMLDQVESSPYKTMILGDFNNTSFSYIYEKLRKTRGFYDAFEKVGQGFGQTFKLKYFPLRIDFMLVDQEIGIKAFHRFKVEYSDHYPIMSLLEL